MFSQVSSAALLSLIALLPMQARSAPAFTVLHDFNRADGDGPGWIARKADGTIYGVTQLGGDGRNTGLGVLYKIAADGAFSIVHTFTDAPDGAIPGKLFLGADDVIFGLTGSGGAHAGGTAFVIDEHGLYSVIHSFDPQTEGAGPSWLTPAPDGGFYGTASDQGVAASCPLHHANGTLFHMNKDGDVTLLHTFCENIDGSIANSVVVAADGKLYGTCREDGPLNGDNSNGGGTFWRATPAGKVKLLHTFGPQFVNTNESVRPDGIVQAADGFFYGVANNGGGFSQGAIFRADAKGHIKTVHPFTPFATDGADPQSNFFLAGDGYFYGTASHGGLPIEDAQRSGVVYRADTRGHVWVLHTYSVEEGMQPAAQPLRDAATRRIFSTAIRGGAAQDGTLGVLDEKTSIPVAKLRIAQEQLVSGQATSGLVKLSHPAPAGGQVVTLNASNATVPQSVTVPQGQKEAAFNIQTDPVDFKFVTTITASVGTLGTSSALTLLPSD